MKTNLLRLVISVLFATTAFAQGPLNPTGAPAPTMKSLQEIYDALEKRVAIPAAPFTITNDGVYYLESNLMVTGAGVSGITVGPLVKVVVIDFRGYSIVGMPGTLHGINVVATNARVIITSAANGKGHTVSKAGNGVHAPNSMVECDGLVIEDGDGKGIVCGKGSNLKNMVVRNNGMTGVEVGSDSDCDGIVAENNGGDGVMLADNCNAQNIRASGNVGVGVRLGNRGWCFRVRADDNGGSGVVAGNGCSLKDFLARSNSAPAIVAGDDSILEDGRCYSVTVPVLMAGSNFLGRNLDLRGTTVTVTLEVRGGSVTFENSVVATPGSVLVGTPASPSVSVRLGFFTTLRPGSFVITVGSPDDTPRAVPSVVFTSGSYRGPVIVVTNTTPTVSVTFEARDSAFEFTTPGTLDLGRAHISGSRFNLATNCSALSLYFSESIIEATEFTGSGFRVGNNSIIRRCTFSDMCGDYALQTGDNSLVESCTFRNVDDPSGIGGNGLRLGTNSIVRNCTVMDMERDGIQASERCLVLNNNICNVGIKTGVTTGACINVLTNGSALIDGNLCTKGDIGINLGGTNTTVIRNKITGNTSAILGIPGNDVAPTSSASSAVNPFSNFP